MAKTKNKYIAKDSKGETVKTKVKPAKGKYKEVRKFKDGTKVKTKELSSKRRTAMGKKETLVKLSSFIGRDNE